MRILTVKSTEERFWEKVARAGEDECWLWTASCFSTGYGSFRASGKKVGAHRFAYRLATGKNIRPSELVRHRCDNPRCVNPKHLELGSSRDNTDDMLERGRSCRGSKQGSSVLSDEQVRLIKKIQGLTLREIAKIFGVSFQHVHWIRTGKSWRHVS